MSHELRTLNSYWSLDEAHLDRVRLEAAGVRAFVSDEQMLGMAWHLGNALQGAKLQVAEDDIDRAQAILDEGVADGDSAESAWDDESDDAEEIEARFLDESDRDAADEDGLLSNLDTLRRPLIWTWFTPLLCLALLFIVVAVTSLMELLRGFLN